MKFDVLVPDWIDGLPLRITVEADSQELAKDLAVQKLKPIFDHYGSPVPIELREAMQVKVAIGNP